MPTPNSDHYLDDPEGLCDAWNQYEASIANSRDCRGPIEKRLDDEWNRCVIAIDRLANSGRAKRDYIAASFLERELEVIAKIQGVEVPYNALSQITTIKAEAAKLK